jgi:hypothetical protein
MASSEPRLLAFNLALARLLALTRGELLRLAATLRQLRALQALFPAILQFELPDVIRDVIVLAPGELPGELPQLRILTAVAPGGQRNAERTRSRCSGQSNSELRPAR